MQDYKGTPDALYFNFTVHAECTLLLELLSLCRIGISKANLKVLGYCLSVSSSLVSHWPIALFCPIPNKREARNRSIS